MNESSKIIMFYFYASLLQTINAISMTYFIAKTSKKTSVIIEFDKFFNVAIFQALHRVKQHYHFIKLWHWSSSHQHLFSKKQRAQYLISIHQFLISRQLRKRLNVVFDSFNLIFRRRHRIDYNNLSQWSMCSFTIC